MIVTVNIKGEQPIGLPIPDDEIDIEGFVKKNLRVPKGKHVSVVYYQGEKNLVQITKDIKLKKNSVLVVELEGTSNKHNTNLLL